MSTPEDTSQDEGNEPAHRAAKKEKQVKKKKEEKKEAAKTTAPPSQGVDVSQLSVDATYISANGAREDLVLRTGKPRKNDIVHVYGDQFRDMYMCELGREQNLPTYIVHPALLQERPQLLNVMKLRRLYLAITSDEDYFVWETAHADPFRSNTWVTSGLRAVERAKQGWVRVEGVHRTQTYILYHPPQKISDPPPPKYGIEQAIEIAYRDRIISSLDHALIKPLLGEVVV